MSEILVALSGYRSIFLAVFELLLLYILVMVVRSMYKKWKQSSEEKILTGDKYRLRTDFDGNIGEVDRQNVIRQILAPDGVDPTPNTYMGISDGGRELYVRSVTISRLPKRMKFAETLKELLAFPNCTSTVFVEPIDNETISRKIDHQINILESEAIGAEGRTNRVRKLDTQVRKTSKWAHEVEDGDNKFFYAGFLFTFVAESVEQLNHITDDFRMLALDKKMDISNCYGVQSEAFLANLPLNRYGNKVFNRIYSDCVKMHLLDQRALSVVLNYTSDHFSHKKGIPLGRNLFNGQPFVFDIFDPGHFGYTIVMAGKTYSGKSATIKMMIERYVPLGYRFVIVDSQTRKGTSEGEYASVTEVNGGINYQISSRKTNILNLFDVQESVEYIKETSVSGYERRTLDLNSAITDIVYILRILLRGNMQLKNEAEDAKIDIVMDSDINDVITRITKELFADLGIVHGDADSLYIEGSIVQDGILQSGLVPKLLPTVTDFYKKLLTERANNKNAQLDGIYRFILSNIRENVRELYYTESGVFFTREEFEKLPANSQKPTERLFNGEPVIVLKGIRPYYDGQSTFAISRDCPVTNIDISQLTEIERRSARNIALHLVDDGFVQKNSERLDKADKLVVVIDEAHESFVDPAARALLAKEVRTGRKRNVGVLFATQTVSEFSRYGETKDILEQAAVKMIFKQDVSNRKELTEPLKISESQAEIIMNRLGVVANKDDPEERTRHRGEMCVIDGDQVLFVKVDYLRRTEALSVETDVSSIISTRQIG